MPTEQHYVFVGTKLDGRPGPEGPGESSVPVLLFDASGHPTHLINGVREAPAESQPEPKQRAHGRARSGSFPNQPTYTIVIPIKP